ncbi:hypothetical protein BCR34DRAFT_605922 [Clohesyomyces aquaticus]|uniref:Extracellular membrane protein CFEM domain-containing protein n=1 Tax=Clohesyomyces aquaticus TaxID=1231657 RepID=A0A1Y1YTX6_9PLEO|nr:hypothetical protein BCR34DRAFT_605922 [Clohesyomyces aquaticus]
MGSKNLALWAFLLFSPAFALLNDEFGATFRSTGDFVPADFWALVTKHCASELTDISSCSPDNHDIKLRTPFAQAYTQCFFGVFEKYFSCPDIVGGNDKQTLIPTGFIQVANFTASKGCAFPAPAPIFQDACTWDVDEIPRSKCCKLGDKEPCGQQNLNLMYCQMQAAEQYVRCTNAQSSKPGTNSTLCVTENAEKATWLPKEYLVYSGAASCPRAGKVLLYLGISNLIAFVSALLSNTQVWKGLFSSTKEYEITEVRVNFLSIFISIGTHISIPFIMGIIIEKQGYTVNWIQQVLIWTIRPRVAPIIAILGLINASWMEIAINEMVADLLFSAPAGAFAIFAAFFPNKTTNPAKPAIYTVFHAGGIIMLIPCVIIVLALLIGALNKCAPIRAFKYPAQDLWRLISNPVRKIRGKEQLEKKSVDMAQFKGWFYIFFGLGIILYIGSWMVWASFLKMAGDLYCPAKLDKLAAVLFAYPVALNAVRVFVQAF